MKVGGEDGEIRRKKRENRRKKKLALPLGVWQTGLFWLLF